MEQTPIARGAISDGRIRFGQGDLSHLRTWLLNFHSSCLPKQAFELMKAASLTRNPQRSGTRLRSEAILHALVHAREPLRGLLWEFTLWDRHGHGGGEGSGKNAFPPLRRNHEPALSR